MQRTASAPSQATPTSPLERLITSHTLYSGTLTYVPMFTQYPENANRRVSSYAQLTSQYEALMMGFGSLAARP